MEDIAEEFPAGRIPSGTCLTNFNNHHDHQVIHIHSVRSFREHLNNEILIFLLLSSYDRLQTRVNDRPDIVHDIVLLATLIMK